MFDILMVMSDLPNGKALAKAFLVDADNRYAVNQRVCALQLFEMTHVSCLCTKSQPLLFLRLTTALVKRSYSMMFSKNAWFRYPGPLTSSVQSEWYIRNG